MKDLQYTAEMILADELFSEFFEEMHEEFDDSSELLDTFNDSYLINSNEDLEDLYASLTLEDATAPSAVLDTPKAKKISRKAIITGSGVAGAVAGGVLGKKALDKSRLKKKEDELIAKIRSGQGTQADIKEWRKLKKLRSSLTKASVITGGAVSALVASKLAQKSPKKKAR